MGDEVWLLGKKTWETASQGYVFLFFQGDKDFVVREVLTEREKVRIGAEGRGSGVRAWSWEGSKAWVWVSPRRSVNCSLAQ